MKHTSLILISLLIIGCNQADLPSEEAVSLETQDQRISYLMGMDNGKNIQVTGVNIDRAAYLEGLDDGLSGAEMQLTEEQVSEAVQTFQTQMMAKQQAMQQAEQESLDLQAKANAEEGAAFHKANGEKEGVVTTESGLQYKVITAGDGPLPTVDSTVEVHYAGRLLDGTEFDSSIKRGVPVQFGVTQVIPGWTEALQLMPEGSKWELYIPAELGYGAGGQGPIGPNATLIFEVELLKANIQEQAEEQAEE
jgi:FKBP-type peptidyl-prolyl cis-trans isomerase